MSSLTPPTPISFGSAPGQHRRKTAGIAGGCASECRTAGDATGSDAYARLVRPTPPGRERGRTARPDDNPPPSRSGRCGRLNPERQRVPRRRQMSRMTKALTRERRAKRLRERTLNTVRRNNKIGNNKNVFIEKITDTFFHAYKKK